MVDHSLTEFWPESWAGDVVAQASVIRAQAEVAFRSGKCTDQRRAALDHVRALVETAEKAATRESGRRRRRLLDRWQGTSVAWAYSHLHAARNILVELLPDADVDAGLPSAVARVGAYLDDRDVRQLHLDRLDQEQHRDRRRAGLKQALEIGYDSADHQHRQVRGFRNMLLQAGGAIAFLMLVIVGIVAMFPSLMPLCFDPTVSTSAATRSETSDTEWTVTRVCPSGEDRWVTENGVRKVVQQNPGRADIVIVAGLGLLGGALSSALAIRKARTVGASTPYDIPLALAVLKVPTGALTAVTGMLLLRGGFVPGLSQLDSQDQILAYALVFGYAQQLATTYIDRRAQSLLESMPSKDTENRRTRRPVHGPRGRAAWRPARLPDAASRTHQRRRRRRARSARGHAAPAAG